MASKVSAAKAALDEITQEVDDSKAKDLVDSAKNQPYYDAKIKLDQLINNISFSTRKLMRNELIP